MTDTGKQKGFLQMVVAGAGAAGLSAALAAAERGLEVDLLEESEQIGGTIAKGRIHTLAGLFTPDGEPVESPICRNLIGRLNPAKRRKMGKLWVLQIDPALYIEVLSSWLKEHPRLRIHLATKINEVIVAQNRIERAEAGTLVFAGAQTAFVDATGSAELAARAGQAEDSGQRSYGLIARVQLHEHIPDQAGRVALKLELESLSGLKKFSVWADCGLNEHELILKFNFSLSPDPVEVKFELEKFFGGRLRSMAFGEAVQRYGPTLKCATMPARKDRERSFPVSWPFESWDGERASVTWPERLPLWVSENYLRSEKLSNLFAAGKSAGIPSPERSAARVTGGCWAMGEQVAKMAARSRT